MQKTAFSLVKSRLALGSPGWLVVTMPKMAQYTGKWLLAWMCGDHIQGQTLFQTILDQKTGIIGPASLLHSRHWVL